MLVGINPYTVELYATNTFIFVAIRFDPSRLEMDFGWRNDAFEFRRFVYWTEIDIPASFGNFSQIISYQI